MSAFDASATSRIDVLESGKKITFITKTNDTFMVPIEYVECSILIKESLEMGKDDPNPEIPLYNISSPTLIKIIEFMIEYTKEPFDVLPKPLPKNGIEDCVRPYYVDFCKNLEMVSENLKKTTNNNADEEDDNSSASSNDYVLEHKTCIMEILQASSFLQINPLKQLCTAYLAHQLREKNFIEIKKMFKCEDLHFDYKKMEALHKQHDWCFNTKNQNESNLGGGSAP
jgi:hypothetical protein